MTVSASWYLVKDILRPKRRFGLTVQSRWRRHSGNIAAPYSSRIHGSRRIHAKVGHGSTAMRLLSSNWWCRNRRVSFERHSYFIESHVKYGFRLLALLLGVFRMSAEEAEEKFIRIWRIVVQQSARHVIGTTNLLDNCSHNSCRFESITRF
jgi:hypothetical protein